MKTNTILLVIAVLIIGGVSGYALSSVTNNQSDNTTSNYSNEMKPTGMHRMPDGTMMDHDAHNDDSMMGHMDSMTVASERDFLIGMIPHHQEAVDTAKEVLARGGTTPEIQQLAEDIIVAQEQEIALMKQWYQDWYREEYSSNSDYQPMMRDLSQLSGAELDRTFLEDMVMHHMGAIMMARSVQPYIENSEISELSQAIMSTQAEEIELMQRLLSEL